MGKDLKGKELGVGLTQRKDGLYQGRYKDRFGKKKSIYGKKITDVRKSLAIAIADNKLYTSVQDEVKLDAWFKRWIDVYKVKSVRANTLREYVSAYQKNISPYLGNRRLNSLVKSDIQNLIAIADENGYQYERQNKIRVLLTDMFARAMEDNLMVSNPAKGVKLYKEKEIRAVALTRSEQDLFFKYCKDTFYDNLFNVAINTGLRPGEIFALTQEDINFEKGYIDVTKTLVYQRYLTDEHKTFHVEPPKTKQSYRKVPINSVCKHYLRKQIELKNVVSQRKPKEQNNFLFVTRVNTPLNSVIMSDAIRTIVRKINETRSPDDALAYFNGHRFRHTFATRCLEAGLQPKVVQSYLGHASLKMTMDLYTHVTQDKAKEDIEKIVQFTQEKRNIISFPEQMSV